MSLLQMSCAGAVMILAIIVIRSLTLNKLPKKTFLALWGIALLRLLIPFALQSPLSIYSLLLKSNLFAGATQNALTPGLLPAPTEQMMPPTNAQVNAVMNGSPLTVIWVIGLLICVLFFATTYWKCYREFRASLPITNEFLESWLHSCDLKRTISIRQSSKISAPLTYGVFRPVILLPTTTEWMDCNSLRYVLVHEYIHIKRFDTITKLVLAVAVCVHWFNPLVWAMYILANRDLEISCDETVVHSFGDKTRSAYAFMLVSMEEKRSFSSLYNSFSKNAIEERIVAIMKMKKLSVVSIALAITLVAGLTTLFATSALSADPLIESGFALAFTDDDGTLSYSENNGRTWLTAAQWETNYPAEDYWSYEDYKAWIDDEKERLATIVNTGAKYAKGEQWVAWTQEEADAAISGYEDILKQIENGALIPKNLDGNGMIIINPITEDELGVSYSASVVGKDGNVIELGNFDTDEARLNSIQQYYDEQVKKGEMTQEEATEYMKNCC